MPKSYEKWCNEVLEYVKDELNLSEWGFHVSYDDPSPDGDTDCLAWTFVDSRYLTAFIHFTPYHHENWADKKYHNAVFTIVHEIVHILVDPLHKYALKSTSEITQPHLVDLVEQSVQRISRIVMKHLPKKLFSA